MNALRRRLISVAATVTLAIVGFVSVASPASANSFTLNILGDWLSPVVSYNDGADTFCTKDPIFPQPGTVTVIAALTPVNGVGPSYSAVLREGTTTCWSLARAYEDTRYKWTVVLHQQTFSIHVWEGYFYS